MKKFVCAALVAVVIMLAAAVPASAATPVPVLTFDSSAPASMQYIRNGTPNVSVATAQMHQSNMALAWGLGSLQDVGGWPDGMIYLGEYYNTIGGVPRYGIDYGPDNVARFVFTQTLSNLEVGETYNFSMGSFFGGIPTPVANGSTAVNAYVKIYDSSNVYEEELLYEVEHPYAAGSLMVQRFSDELLFEFVAQQAYLSLDIVIEVRPWRATLVSGSGANNVVWFGFVDAVVVAVEQEDEWQNEQRGFWAKILAFLQDIIDGIKAIPEMISNIITAIGDFFKLVWRWITFIFRLVIKAMEIMMAISTALPFWIVGAFVALIAVCVVYKILGREASG